MSKTKRIVLIQEDDGGSAKIKYTDIDKFLNEQLRKQKISYHKTYANLSVNGVVVISMVLCQVLAQNKMRSSAS